jgi:hypothetical protein
MSLGKKLTQAVQKEAAMKTPFPIIAEASDTLRGNGRKSRGVTAAVKLADNDRFSHMAEEVVVRVENGTRDAKSVAQRFSERATYLCEALKFVECAGDGAAIVRSTPETMAAKRAPYFEARVKSDEITLRRYQPHLDKPGRAPTPFCVTDDVLTRLVDDAASALALNAKK